MSNAPATTSPDFLVAVPGLDPSLTVRVSLDEALSAHPSVQRFAVFYTFKTRKAAERRAASMTRISRESSEPFAWSLFVLADGTFAVGRPLHYSDGTDALLVLDGNGAEVSL
jgi:hypothetical protein